MFDQSAALFGLVLLGSGLGRLIVNDINCLQKSVKVKQKIVKY